MLLTEKIVSSFKREKRAKLQRKDVVSEQVKSLLQNSSQKLILMVRG